MAFIQRYFRKDKSNAVNLHSMCCFKELERKNKMKNTTFQSLTLALLIAVVSLTTISLGSEVLPPIADAGFSRYVAQEPIVLDGTGSYDPDNSGPLRYEWRQIAGPPIVIIDANTATPSIGGDMLVGTEIDSTDTLVGFYQTDEVQECVFELVVNDGEYDSLADTVKVVIVPDFGANTLKLVNEEFDPNKPTFVFFTGGSTCADGGGDVIDDPGFLELVNHIGFPQGYGPDPTSGPRTFYKYANMMIVFLSSVAPDYQQPIQTCGFSAGGMPALDVGAYLNGTYADPRYAVNRVTLLDGAFCLERYGQPLKRIEEFTQNAPNGEPCWIDNYAAANRTYYPNVLNVALPLSHGDCAYWYFNSFNNLDATDFNGGLVAGAYLSVLGPGKNLNPALTLNPVPYKFQWYGSVTSGYMLFLNQRQSPGRLPEPVRLIGPADGTIVDANGVIFGCEVSENAIGYQLLFGSDPYRVMDYLVISDTLEPPTNVITSFPYEQTWWTVQVYDSFGSTIYADPICIYPEKVMPQTIENITKNQEYVSIQQAINDATDGQEIVISPGIYRYLKNVKIEGKDIILRSIDPYDPATVATTVINGGQHGPVISLSGSQGSGCLLAGLTITGGTVGVSCSDASPTIRNCTIESNNPSSIEFWYGYEPLIINCNILGQIETDKNDPSLVALWKLDETEGDVAQDSIGENDGTIYGEPTWKPNDGVKNGALEFNGIDDYIGTSSVIEAATDSFSIFAWIKGGTPGQTIISQANTANLIMADTSEGKFTTELASRRGVEALVSEMVITDGDWHRVGLTWDGIEKVLYVDDMEAASKVIDAGISEDGLYIGAGKNLEAGSFWFGLIDDVRIYNRAIIP